MRQYTRADVAGQGAAGWRRKDLGFAPGDRVALVSKNTAHWLMGDLAIWMAGYVSVPLYPTLAADTGAPDPRAQREQLYSSASSTTGMR